MKTESVPAPRSPPARTSRPGRVLSWRVWRWWIGGGLGLLAVAAVLWPWPRGESGAGETVEPLTHTVKRGDLLVTVTERGTLESSENTEIKCKVRGQNTITWVIENGSMVEPGDELLRLDTLFIEEQINERSKYAHWSRSGAESWRATVARAELALPEYLEGRYVTQMMTLEKDLAIAESNLRTAQSMLDFARVMYERGYRSELDYEDREMAVKRAKLAVEVKKTEIDVLRDYTKAMELETLKGDLAAAKAEFSANDERARADVARRDRAIEELGYCEIQAERAGMVIYPTARAWEQAPEIEEGATVHRDQVLLLMPDLTKMQVKIGVHEAIVDRLATGLPARVTLPDRELDAEVSSVSSVARPAGWWTGNVVKYDTIVRLPPVDGLKPGMSAVVEVILARYEDVLLVPVVAVLETAEGAFCWVKTGRGPERRTVRLGDTNELFVVVEAGLVEGDEVVLEPAAGVPEARRAALEVPGKGGDEAETGAQSAGGDERP